MGKHLKEITTPLKNFKPSIMDEKQKETTFGFKELEIELKLLDFKQKNKEDSAYIAIVDKASKELRELIVEKTLDSLSALRIEMDEQKKHQESKDQLALDVCQIRNYEENPEEFTERRIVELRALKLMDKTIIKIIANTVWPGNERTRLKLAETTSLELLKVLIRDEKQRLARIAKEKNQREK